MNIIEQIRDMKAYLDSKEEAEHCQKDIYDLVLIHINSKVDGWRIEYPKGKGDLRPLIKKVGPRLVMEATDISAEQYLEYDEGRLTEDSVQKYYKKIGGIAYNKSKGIVF